MPRRILLFVECQIGREISEFRVELRNSDANRHKFSSVLMNEGIRTNVT